MSSKRICIYPKDVMIITGKSERTGSRMLQEIRIHYGKEKGAYVTFKEFAEFTGIPEQAVYDLIFGSYGSS